VTESFIPFFQIALWSFIGFWVLTKVLPSKDSRTGGTNPFATMVALGAFLSLIAIMGGVFLDVILMALGSDREVPTNPFMAPVIYGAAIIFAVGGLASSVLSEKTYDKMTQITSPIFGFGILIYITTDIVMWVSA